MHRTVFRLAALACLAGALTGPAQAASPSHPQRAPAAQAPASRAAEAGQPPHAWLFGTWTGGIFPVPSNLTREACLSQPVVIFTRDLVLRATLTSQFYTQRLIVTALTTTDGTQFHFTPPGPAEGGLLAGGSPASAGFGCADPDTLMVARQNDNVITFPGCAEFPNPLVRCR